MRILFLCVALCSTALASQSLNLNGAGIFSDTTSTASAYNGIGSYRAECMIENLATPGSNAGIFSVNVQFQITIRSSGYLVFLGPNGAEGTSHSIPAVGAIPALDASIRLVAQRNNVTGKYTLETWGTTSGRYTLDQGNITTTGIADMRSTGLWVGDPSGVNANIKIGFCRWYSSTRPLGGKPPSITSPGTPGDLADYELDGNLTDTGGQSLGNLALSSGSPAYVTTAIGAPILLSTATPTTVRTNYGFTIDYSASFSNNDNPTLTFATTVTAGTGTLSASTTDMPSYITTADGEHTLHTVVTDASSNTGSADVTVGAVPSDSQGIVTIANALFSRLIGPVIRFAANPWGYADDRNKKLADVQKSMQSTVFQDFWTTPAAGTIAVVNGGSTITGTGTAFKDLFCNGGTTVYPDADHPNQIIIKHPSADYPGTFGNAYYAVTGCPTQTSLTISPVYQHSATGSGLHYSMGTYAQVNAWVYSNVPANYYDGVKGFYALWKRTGLTAYRDAARTLASRFWYGPPYNQGASFTLGGWLFSSPARGASVDGLIMWADDTGVDIWPGMHHVWDWWIYAIDAQIAQGQMGDLREDGYEANGMALCARLDPDATYRANCAAALNRAIDNLWTPLKVSGGVWRTTAIQSFFAGPGVSVHLVDGSPNITLTGATWTTASFTELTTHDRGVWFLNDVGSFLIQGKQSSDAGDTAFYMVSSVDSTTTATLTANYNSGSCPSPSGCDKRMSATILPGFGTQPYQLGMAGGFLGSSIYDYYVLIGDTTRAAKVKGWVADIAAYLTTTALDITNLSHYYGVDFLSCAGAGQTTWLWCKADGTQSLTAESLKAFSYNRILNGPSATDAIVDAMYHRLFGKPGFSAPSPFTPGSYLTDLDDGQYMTDPTQAISNKWFGFFFGYGSAADWPAVQATLTPSSISTSGNPQSGGAMVFGDR